MNDMSNFTEPSSSKRDSVFEDDEIFDDSAFLANFENSSFRQAKVSETNINESINTSGLNISALCCDEEISGYDKLTGRTWIYPTNYPVRDYQFNIIKAAILKNTLVSLPTGLGKTFIAAVIMYNFYRWYPLGKIVFTAPTRPLVAQQIEACYSIIAIPPNDTIEMTGHMQVQTRKSHWQNKRVFFATPQVIYNDLKSGICPADKIRCLVMDEAHRARGNYAYCQIVSTLDDMGCKTYRMLALSATPGSKVDDVINVVRSLHIAHLELRTENCIDVAPYSHSRKINTVIVQLGPELTQLRKQYVEILDTYARRLKQFNILPQNLGNLSKGRIVMLYKEYQTKDRGARHPQHNYIMKDFTLLIALYHGLELLVKHGSRVFLNFFDEHPEKSWIQSDDNLTALLERLRDDLGVNPLALDRSILPDGTIPEMPKDLCFGHPKFDKLKSIILDHFTSAKQKNQDTRAIIFCEYRESVNLVHCLLLQCRPLITPQMFVGQGASGKDGKTVISQKQQLRVMRSFREGGCNTLVATCVAEEGLDVGSVDLILCFDISTRSPIRLVQRCGRTGRERGGQVYILVTEGREHQTLLDCMRQRDGLNKKIQQSKEVHNNLYNLNPRMMPHGFTPDCQKMFITVAKKTDTKDTEKTSKKGQKDLRSMLLKNRASTSGASSSNRDNDNLITEEEFKLLFPEGYQQSTHFGKPRNHWAMNKGTFESQAVEINEEKCLNLSSWLEWQRTLQKTVNIGNSKDTEFLSNFLQKCDVKRFEATQIQSQASQNIVTTHTQEALSQNVVFPVLKSPIKTVKLTKKKQKAPVAKSPSKNYGDIRALFSATTKSTKSYTKLINDLGIQNDGSVSTKLINLLVDLNLNVDNTNVKTCYICQHICDCKILRSKNHINTKAPVLKKFLEDSALPDLDLIDEIDADLIAKCKSFEGSQDLLNYTKTNIIDTRSDNNCSKNFDLEFELDEILKSPETQVDDSEMNSSKDKNFDIGDIDDIFADSSPEEAIQKTLKDVEIEHTAKKENVPTEVQKALGFFGLDSIDDIFADSDDEITENPSVTAAETTATNIGEDSSEIQIINTAKDLKVDKDHMEIEQKQEERKEEENVPNNVYPRSPSILSGRLAPKDVPTSPILCSQVRKFKLSTKKNKTPSTTPNSSVKKKLILPDSDNNNFINITDEKSHKTISNKNVADVTEKSMFTVTQIVEMINKTQNKSNVNTSKVTDVTTLDDERSTSPILLTQADKKKSININNSANKNKQSFTKSESLIILDSDSDSNDTETYDVEKEMSKIDTDLIIQSSLGGKRKFDNEDIQNTPSLLNKKPKLENTVPKPLSLQEKVLAALSSNKNKDNGNKGYDTKFKVNNNQLNFHCTVSQYNKLSHKENSPPSKMTKQYNNEDDIEIQQSPIEMLQKYRKDKKLLTLRKKFDSIFKSPVKQKESVLKSPVKLKESPNKIFEDLIDDRMFSPKCNNTSRNEDKENTPVKRKILFEDSDDDFMGDSPKKPTIKTNEVRITKNHKVRKKKHQRNAFIEMEASVSDASESGDELTDDSDGSIAEFICDDDADVTKHPDMLAVYLKSVRSPVKKNGFKIPELPKRFQKEEVFSQFVEEDAYEMDSFCVDSHIGLTQINDVSELELAEIVLEEKRRSKKKAKRLSPTQQNDESPVIKRKNKNYNRLIHSDSDDST